MTHAIDHNKSRLSTWLVAFGALVLLAGGIVTVAWLVNQLATLRAFEAETETMRLMMNTWSTTPPPGVDSHIWNEAVGLAYTAHGNVCYSPEEVSLEEMRRLRADMEAKSQGLITLNTLDWLWMRLAYTGPHGLKYSTQMRPLWDEMRDAVISRTLPASSYLQSTINHLTIASFPYRKSIARRNLSGELIGANQQLCPACTFRPRFLVRKPRSQRQAVGGFSVVRQKNGDSRILSPILLSPFFCR